MVARLGLLRKSCQLGDVEAAGGEPAERLRASTTGCMEGPGAFRLGLEARDRLGRRAGLEALALEQRADRGVAVAARGERPGAAGGQAGVVDEPGALERVERGCPRGGSGPARGEPGVESLPRAVAVLECAHGDPERVLPAKLSAERARRLSVERAPDGEPGPDDRVGGNEPPRRAVELDLDAVAGPFP